LSLFGRLTFASVRLTDGAPPIFQPQTGTILSPEMVDEMIVLKCRLLSQNTIQVWDGQFTSAEILQTLNHRCCGVNPFAPTYR